MDGVRERVRQALEKLTSEEELIRLFGTDALDYNVVLQDVSTRAFTERAKEPITKIQIVAKHGAFNIVHARLKTKGKLNLTDERPIIAQLFKVLPPYFLAVFSDANDELWHFVNVKLAPFEGEDAQKDVKIRRLFRRITVGPLERIGDRLRTASERLAMLQLAEEDVPALALQSRHDKAFDVEEVTEKFYEAYKIVFEALQRDLLRQTENAVWAHDYALQFLNRIMFLHFVQRKRWLGDDPEFIRAFWNAYTNSGQPVNTFFDSWLKVLFFEAFNGRYQNRALYDARFPKSIRQALAQAPHLNGGLFSENDLDETFKRRAVAISDARFRKIFEFFAGFNFTISEDTPFDQEVAVDPEMIGKVYEGLVNVKAEGGKTKDEGSKEARREAGIFYTPRTEIDLMCRLSLVDHLANRIGREHKQLLYEAIFAFDPDDIEASDGTIGSENLWKPLDEVLRDITVLDPACGSGSFLVGMLSVIDHMSKRANNALGKPERAFDRRKRIIGNALYGVDVMRWAVDVAELRLWLHLMIETEIKKEQLTLEPLLPNLSFNVRCGDSLVQQIGDLDFSLIRGGRRSAGSYLGSLPTRAKGKLTALIGEKRKFYYGDPGRSCRTEAELESAETELFRTVLSEGIKDIRRRMVSIDASITRTQSAVFGGEAKALTHADIKALNAKRQSLADEMSSIQTASAALEKETHKPFIWDIAFVEVFGGERGGFDIVIGNPPYVRQEKIADPRPIGSPNGEIKVESKRAYKGKLARSLYGAFPEYFNYNLRTGAANPSLKATNDLYVYFYFHGLSLLNPQGSFCFITSNSWLDVGYGKDLQQFLLENCAIKMIIDNEAKRSFKASDVNTIIALFGAPVPDVGAVHERPEKHERGLSDHTARFVMFKVPFETALSSIVFEEIEEAENRRVTQEFRVHTITQADLFRDGCQQLPTANRQLPTDRYTGNKWGGKYLRAPDIYWTILEKGKGKLVRLGDIATVRFGIKTGANEFFYLNDAKIAEWAIEQEFLKPVIKSPRECKRILINPKDLKYKIFMCHKTRQDLAGTAALEYIQWGESQRFHERPSCRGRRPWHDISDKLWGKLLWPMVHNDRLNVFWNPERVVVDHNLFEIIPQNEDLAWGSLSCSAQIIFRELYGRANLGQGALKTEGMDIAALACLTESRAMLQVIDRLQAARLRLSTRKIMPVHAEIDMPDRRALDDIIFDVLGLTRGERDAVYEAVIDLVEKRLKKAKSV